MTLNLCAQTLISLCSDTTIQQNLGALDGLPFNPRDAVTIELVWERAGVIETGTELPPARLNNGIGWPYGKKNSIPRDLILSLRAT